MLVRGGSSGSISSTLLVCYICLWLSINELGNASLVVTSIFFVHPFVLLEELLRCKGGSRHLGRSKTIHKYGRSKSISKKDKICTNCSRAQLAESKYCLSVATMGHK